MDGQRERRMNAGLRPVWSLVPTTARRGDPRLSPWRVVTALLLLGLLGLGLRSFGPLLSAAAFVDTTATTSTWTTAASFAQGWQQISLGQTHTCGIDEEGAGWCWGDGDFGRLGTGDTTQRWVPTRVVTTTMDRPLALIAAGAHYTCAVDIDGKPWCWGSGTEGTLGRGSTADSLVPVAVTTTSMSQPVTAITTSGYHTCGISGGAAWCWGSGSVGQLGNGTSADALVPSPVSTSTGMSPPVTDISAGLAHTCAVSGGVAWCWGWGTYGRLGDGNTTTQTQPVQVTRTTMSANIAQVATGDYHTCAVDVKGKPWCWGFGGAGNLGHGSTTDSSVPVAVTVTSMPSSVTWIHAGHHHTCTTVTSGTAWCWGQGLAGTLGNSASVDQTAPVAVTSSAMSPPIHQVRGGWAHTCALRDGEVWCWGNNLYGQLGLGSTTGYDAPQFVVD